MIITKETFLIWALTDIVTFDTRYDIYEVAYFLRKNGYVEHQDLGNNSALVVGFTLKPFTLHNPHTMDTAWFPKGKILRLTDLLGVRN